MSASPGGRDNPFDAESSVPGESTWNPLVLRETSPPPPQGRVDASSPELANLLITLREQQERENQLETQRRQRQAIPMLQRVEETDAGLRAVRIELDRAERVVLETQSQVNVLARTNLVPRELTNSQRVDLSSLRAVVYGMRSVVDGALRGSRLVIAQLRLPPVHSLTRNAARVRLDPPVSRKGLWLTDKRPPDVVSVSEHHIPVWPQSLLRLYSDVARGKLEVPVLQGDNRLPAISALR
ncbi:hypothetical protein B0H15DRAFT_795319 [Mycena belliarum]|uniref:Uncharacterized protein n=1 Tax=Mycena belliarum TaxID=1033014 RepID=A0AAD6XU07_9AGAR|nr:hypothetical protein B0H15DRAFT_795319 [Mycena belliae]